MDEALEMSRYTVSPWLRLLPCYHTHRLWGTPKSHPALCLSGGYALCASIQVLLLLCMNIYYIQKYALPPPFLNSTLCKAEMPVFKSPVKCSRTMRHPHCFIPLSREVKKPHSEVPFAFSEVRGIGFIGIHLENLKYWDQCFSFPF